MLFRVFGPDKYGIRVKEKCKPYCCDNIPKVKYCENAIVCASQKRHKMGVYDARWRFVPESGVKVRRKHVQKYNSVRAVPYVDYDVMFLGEVHWHFGHFLLEHTDRLWAAMQKQNVQKFVFVFNKNAGKIPSWLYEFTSMMGIKCDDVLVIDKTTRFKSVSVPEPSVNKNAWTSLWPETFQYMANNVKDVVCADKIYVSRDSLKHRRTFGEKSVQSVFKKNGFEIVYPEQLDLPHQVAIMKNARVLAGCAGTALHLALFMKPGGRVVQIKRNSGYDDNCVSQHLICDACGHDLDLIWASAEIEQTQHFTNVPQFISVGKYMQNWFDENKFNYDANDTVQDAHEFAEYSDALVLYKKQYGGKEWNKFKKKMIKLSACFIPVPRLRDMYYNFMKNKFVSR